MSKIYAFDLDDTLCYRDKNSSHVGVEKYRYCKPIPQMISRVNELFDLGNTIYIYTARGMETFNGDVEKCKSELYELTLESLKNWGVKHNGLIMGKINYDYLIDDKSIGHTLINEFINNKDKFN